MRGVVLRYLSGLGLCGRSAVSMAAAVASRMDGFRLPIRSGRSAVLDIQRKDSIYLGAGTTCDRRLRQTSDGVGWRFESGGWTGIADTSLAWLFFPPGWRLG